MKITDQMIDAHYRNRSPEYEDEEQEPDYEPEPDEDELEGAEVVETDLW